MPLKLEVHKRYWTTLDFANSKIASQGKKVADQDKAISELIGGVKALTIEAS